MINKLNCRSDMSKLVLEKNIKDMKIKEMQEFLRSVGSYHSLKNKAEYIKRMSAFKNIVNFPWREEQLDVINNFLKFQHDTYVIHAVFGNVMQKTQKLCYTMVQ